MTITEITPGKYVAPAFDNRRRGGRPMWNLMVDNDVETATMIQFDGNHVEVRFETMGWRIV